MRKVEVLPRAIQRKIGRRALRAGAKIAKPQIQKETPVRKTPKPLSLYSAGHLKRSHKIRAIKRTRKYIGVRIATQFGKPFQDQPPAEEAFYAIAVHYGHFVGSKKLGKARPRTKPNRWMERGMEKAKDQVINTIKKSVGDDLDKLWAQA